MFNHPLGILQAKFESFWICLVTVGITDSLPRDERKYIRFTNVIAVLTTFAVVVYIPNSLIKGFYSLAAIQLVDTFFVLSVLWLNYMHYHKTARHIYMLVINVFVIINACYIGHNSNVHEFFYITYIAPFLLFSVRDYKNIIGGILTAVIAYNLYYQIYPNFTQYNVDLGTQQGISQINLLMRFVLFGAAIYILAFYNYRAESELDASNIKLIDQTLELKRSNEDLEQFVSIISHDLKAPARNISSFMTLLLSRYGKNVDADAKDFMQLSKDSADRLTKQIDDLLSYSKVGRNLPPTAVVDVDKMIRSIQFELREKIDEKNVTIEIEGKLPQINDVHSSMIHHVFQNLIANAIKFNTKANSKVKIGFTLNKGTICFYVSDNGIGISSEHKETLFHMFKRLHTVDEFEGTGIGLAVCKKIVNFYKGDIWFESELNKGTTFFFTLKKSVSEPSIAMVSEISLLAVSATVAI